MQTEKKLALLEKLVEELVKDPPEEATISRYMSEAGLTDSKNPIDRINKVLLALNFEQPDKEIQE